MARKKVDPAPAPPGEVLSVVICGKTFKPVEALAAAVERAEKAEAQIAALDYGLKAAHHRARCLKGELTKLQEAQKAAKARIKELEDSPKVSIDYEGMYRSSRRELEGYQTQAKLYRDWRIEEASRADKYQAEAEALRKLVPKPFTCGDIGPLFPVSFFVGGLTGAVLGGIGALIAVGGLL